ncbi:MAG TPA: response regulator [Bacteroidales bacterium]|nr:response regulator [Bacteroidales bacterium]
MIKVFILDDDDLHSELNTLMMKTIGVTDIDICSSGREAMQYLEGCKTKRLFPSLMLIDLNMPGMNGLSFIKNYEEKYRQYSPGTYIVMLTNSILDSDKDEAMQYKSVLYFLNKPLTTVRLTEIIRKIEALTDKQPP